MIAVDVPVWPTDAAQAIALQTRLRHQVRIADENLTVKTIAGIDVSHKDELSQCALVLMNADTLDIMQSLTVTLPMGFPYIPGLLSFREIPVILKALAQLATPPDLAMIDGQGVAHPRRLGIASHLGVLTGLPTIGVAKSRLTGRYAEPDNIRGAYTDLTDKGEKIGYVLRSKINCNPLFISPGHRVSFETALDWTLRTLRHYRLPEPTRIADKISKIKDGPALLL